MTPANTSHRPPLWRLVWEKVREDHIPLRAAALSFQTLTSFVPLLVILLAVLSGPAFQDQRERVLDKIVEVLVPASSHSGEASASAAAPPAGEEKTEAASESKTGAKAETKKVQREIQERFKDKVRATVGRLTENVAKVSMFSFLVLLVIATLLFQTVENTFNAIWKVNGGRSIFIKIAITTALIFWAPVVMLISIWLTELFKDLPILGVYVLPMLLTAFAFTAFYMIMPHVKVRLTAALLGGLLGAVMWELSKVGFLIYVSYAVGMSKVYGSLGIIPMLFGWVYLSWVVVLAGADLSYIVQHHRTIVEQWETRERHNRLITNAKDWAQREAAMLPVLAFAAAVELASRFRAGACPGGAKLSELAEALGVEPGVCERALQRLTAGGVASKVAGEGDEPRFLPASDLARCPIAEVARACRGTPPVAGASESWRKAMETIERMEREGEKAIASQTLADLVPPPPAPQAAPNPAPASGPKPAAGSAVN